MLNLGIARAGVSPDGGGNALCLSFEPDASVAFLGWGFARKRWGEGVCICQSYCGMNELSRYTTGGGAISRRVGDALSRVGFPFDSSAG